MRRVLLLSLFSLLDVAAAESSQRAQLERAIYVRGLTCDQCSVAEMEEVMARNPGLSPDPELVEAFEEEAQSRRKARDFKLTHDEFIEQMNATEPGGVTGRRAERMWESFQAQLKRGAVKFLPDGNVQFGVPLTHQATEFLPDAVCDAIENAFAVLLNQYLKVPRKYRRRLEVRIDYLHDNGGLHIAAGMLAVLLVLELVRTFFFSGADDAEAEPEVEKPTKARATRRGAKSKSE